MNQWQNGQADGAFSQQGMGHINPAMFSNLNNAGQFDGFAQQQSGLQNGGQIFPGQTFQAGSVVPQKRMHDGSGMSGSPPPPNPSNQASRSQTPNFAGGFPNQQAGQQFGAAATPTPYGHLQQPGSNHATPSPTMQNQPFRQPSRMSNASPNPFPQQQANFNGQMQNANTQSMGQPGQMAALNQQFAMGQNMNMANMQNMQQGMPGQQQNNMTVQQQQQNQQRQYQMRLMQQQAALRAQQQNTQRQNGAMNNPAMMQNNAGMNNQGQGAAGMQNGQQNMMKAKRNQFLTQCAAFVARVGRQFNPQPLIAGRPVDLYNLFTIVVAANGSSNIERNQQWHMVANKLGFNPAQYPTAAEELKSIFIANVGPYEKMWMSARASQKQEQARQHAQQMAGFSGGSQASPTKMQPPNLQQQQQAQQLAQQQQQQQQQHQQPHQQPTQQDQQQQQPPQQPQQQFQQQFQQAHQQSQSTPQPQSTPVQANASIPPQNGVSTPQQMMGVPGSLQHRRSSSMLKTMTPQSTPHPATMQSPANKVQQSPLVKTEAPPQAVVQVPRSTNYTPTMRTLDTDGGLDIQALYDRSSQVLDAMPILPAVHEMGVIDIRAITLSLASGIHSEVRYALDTLSVISADGRIPFDLDKCDDLVDVLIDCGEEQIEFLAGEAEEVSDTIDLPSYEDVVRGARHEAESLQEVAEMGTTAWNLERAADRLIAITTILRNLSGYHEHNYPFLTTPIVAKWISNTLRHVGTRNNFLRSHVNMQDFYKDLVIFLSNVSQVLELPSREDALHILHFILVFTPQPAPQYTTSTGRLTFMPFVPAMHRYLPPAVDCLAKLLARQDPNRSLFRSIFRASSANTSNGSGNNSSEEDPVDLLTRTFALSLSVLPMGSKSTLSNPILLRIAEARKPYLMQGMLAADIITTLLPANDSDLARSWVESEDGWAVNLLNLASLLSVEQPPRPPMPGAKHPQMHWDTESFRLISHRALSMLKRLAERAGHGVARRLVNGETKAVGASKSSDTGGDGDGVATEAQDDDEPYAVKKFEGFPQGDAIIGAMMLHTIDKESLRLLCGLHDLALQT